MIDLRTEIRNNEDEEETPQIQVEHCVVDGIELFRLAGVLIHKTTREVKELILPTLNKPSVTNVVISFSEVTALDSSGIGTMILFYRVMRARGANIVFCDFGRNLMRLMRMGQLHEILSLWDTEEKAFAHFQSTFVEHT
ncbi:STAS domain-containing protein [Deltaproteobacteria bacterium TL4]